MVSRIETNVEIRVKGYDSNLFLLTAHTWSHAHYATISIYLLGYALDSRSPKV